MVKYWSENNSCFPSCVQIYTSCLLCEKYLEGTTFFYYHSTLCLIERGDFLWHKLLLCREQQFSAASNFSATQKTFFSRSIICVSDNQLLIMTLQIQRHFHVCTGVPSSTFSEGEPFCDYTKKLLCISACKISGLRRLLALYWLALYYRGRDWLILEYLRAMTFSS